MGRENAACDASDEGCEQVVNKKEYVVLVREQALD
jgi:hypothetical protein